MADAASTKSNTPFEDLMLVLFGALLVSNMFQQAPRFLQEKLGVDIGSPHLVAGAGLTEDTPLGTRVSVVNGGAFYDKAGGTAGGSIAPGASLVVTKGPETTLGGERWWYVEDPATGTGGWVRESTLVREGAGGLGPETKEGTQVRALLATSVWRLPAGSDKVGDVQKGARGVVTDGPQTQHGARWWFFDQADSHDDGWMPESALVLASDQDWHAGSPVRSMHEVDLFERAGGGRTLGTAQEGERLSIVGGPQLVGGEYWWYVETSSGVQGWVSQTSLEDASLQGWVKGAVATTLTLAVVFTVLLLGGIVYAAVRTAQIRARELARMKAAIPQTMQPMRNERWDKIRAHVALDNPNDWRLAIIEADIILDELVTRMGYHGMTLGDKLKQASRGDFKTLDNAWEAHRVRNQIAHEGSDFILTQREAKRVIALYESVFDEFKYS